MIAVLTYYNPLLAVFSGYFFLAVAPLLFLDAILSSGNSFVLANNYKFLGIFINVINLRNLNLAP